MSETTHDLTQRAEKLPLDVQCREMVDLLLRPDFIPNCDDRDTQRAADLIRDLSAALVQAEQREAKLNTILRDTHWELETARSVARTTQLDSECAIKAAEAKLVQAEQEKAEARQIVAAINNEMIGSGGYFTERPALMALVEENEQLRKQLAALGGTPTLGPNASALDELKRDAEDMIPWLLRSTFIPNCDTTDTERVADMIRRLLSALGGRPETPTDDTLIDIGVRYASDDETNLSDAQFCAELRRAFGGGRPETGWQPIATAPKDGRDILAWDGERPCVILWSGGVYWCEDSGPKMLPEPTHWQPLPSPPLQEQP